MIETTALILGREDLHQYALAKNIDSLVFEDFKVSIKPFKENSIILFIDYNLATKILKNRYGDNGEALLKHKLLELIKTI